MRRQNDSREKECKTARQTDYEKDQYIKCNRCPCCGRCDDDGFMPEA